MIDIPEDKKELLIKRFEKSLINPVKILFFTQEMECSHCAQTREILELVRNLSSKISYETHQFSKELEVAKKYGVDKIPALVILGEKDYGIRYFGAPSGYEFIPFVDTLIYVSRGETKLDLETKSGLKDIRNKTIIKVFVLLTCPYCPEVVKIANQMAVENDNIFVELTDIAEFPQIAVKYNIISTPKVAINENVQFVGVQPVNIFLGYVKAGSREGDTFYT
jgi:glutaredoxin-like protein